MKNMWGNRKENNSVITSITKDNSVINVITDDNKTYQNITNITDNVNVSVNDNVSVIENKNIIIYSEKFIKFNEWLKEQAPRVLKMKEPFTEKQMDELIIKGELNKKEDWDVLKSMHNYKDLLKKNISASLTYQNWRKRNNDTNRTNNKSNSTEERRQFIEDHLRGNHDGIEPSVQGLF
jgi:hypothetical protein